MEYAAAVYIGRFQPFHKAHLEVVQHGLKIANRVIILVGSAYATPTVENPFTFQQRKNMIELCFHDDIESLNRISILPIRDYFYNENFWVTDVQARVAERTSNGGSIALLGAYKDSSSYYLKYFPQWEFTPVKSTVNLNATDIRNKLWAEDDGWKRDVHKKIADWIQKKYIDADEPNWEDLVESKTGYRRRCEEHKFYEEYKKPFASLPFPPVFVTVDAVVIQSGHVLVVKRKFNPGKDLFALPGGFIKNQERIKAAAIRELKEETGIHVPAIILESSIVDSAVFDHPKRSLRGRTITHGFHIKLKDGELPAVKGSDDAARAFWMPLMDVMAKPDRFFEDHVHIINYFVSKQ